MMTAERAMGTGQEAMREAGRGGGAVRALRRGACPTLAAPMATGDGLLVRLRPVRAGFTPQAFLALLDAAEIFGNGRLDITARGNLQVRGLTPDSAPHFARAVRRAGISVAEGLAVEIPPLAGLDPLEIADPRPLASRLGARLAASGLVLAPKLSVVVDGGGRLHLGDVPADLRLVAEREASQAAGAIVWHVFLGSEAEPIASGTAGAMEEAALSALRRIAALGPQARARDLARRSAPSRPTQGWRAPPQSPVGRIALDGRELALGVAPAFGQLEAAQARTLVRLAADEGATELRLAAGRALLFLGLDPQGAQAVEAWSAEHGFVTRPDDPALAIDACSGAQGCASGGMRTRAIGQLVIGKAPALTDGSLRVHLSGCPKGCARPRATTVTLVAVPGSRADDPARLGLVLDGRADDGPIATASLDSAASAVAALGDLVAHAKQSGESAASCLKRLGPARIAASFQRD